MKIFKSIYCLNVIINLFILWLCFNVSVYSQDKCLIVKVHDGDTYSGYINGKKYQLRLQNIDCPELSQTWGYRSRDSVSRLILNRNVIVNINSADRYNRLLVNLYIDKMCLDSIIVMNGWGWIYDRYNSKKELITLQENAITNRKGLFNQRKENIITPWEWRLLHKR